MKKKKFLHLNPEDKELILKSATYMGLKFETFIRMAAIKEARRLDNEIQLKDKELKSDF